MNKNTNSFLNEVFSIIIGSAGVLLVSVSITPILVRLVPVEAYGVFVSSFAFFKIIELVARGGLFDATRKYVAGATTAESRQDTLRDSIALGVFYGVFASVLLLVVEFLFGLPSIQQNHLLILLPAVVFGNIVSVFQAYFYGLQHERVTELSRVMHKICYGIIGLGLTSTLGIVGMFIGYSASAILVGIGLTTITISELGLLKKIYNYQASGRTYKIARYGAIQTVGGVSAMLLYKTDILLISYFQGAAEAGIYQAALTPTEYIWFVPGAIQAAMLQNVSHLWSQESLDQIDLDVTKGLKYSFLSLSLLAIGLFSLTEEFLIVYFSPEYIGGSTALMILLLGAFGFGLARVIIPVFQATGWLKYTESLTVAVLLINIILNIGFIPVYGIEGAAVATSISYGLMFIGAIILWWRSEFHFVNTGEIPRWFGAVGTFAAIYLGVDHYFQLSTIPSLLILPLVGAIIFIGCCLTFGIVQYEQIWQVFPD